MLQLALALAGSHEEVEKYEKAIHDSREFQKLIPTLSEQELDNLLDQLQVIYKVVGLMGRIAGAEADTRAALTAIPDKNLAVC